MLDREKTKEAIKKWREKNKEHIKKYNAFVESAGVVIPH
jgi:post-segregation antitoxin (ccd killing protein)